MPRIFQAAGLYGGGIHRNKPEIRKQACLPFLQKACISLSYFSFLGVTLHQTSS